MPVRLIDRSRTRDFLGRVARGRRALVAAVGAGTATALMVCLAAAILVPAILVGWLVCVRDTDTMLDTAQARAAVLALLQRAGPGIGVRTLEITPREMIVLAVDKDRPAWRFSRHGGRSARNYVETSPDQTWHITHRTLFWGWRDWINAPDPDPVFDDVSWHKAFDIRPEDIPDLAELSRSALRRVGLEGTATVLSIVLDSRRWTVRLNSQLGIAEVPFDRTDERAERPRQNASIAPPATVRPPETPRPVSAAEALARGAEARSQQDFAAGAEWDRKAAEQGAPEGQFNLGIAYEKGEGVAQDLAEAFRWYRMAAEQGLAAAQNLVGASYANGRGVGQDYGEALHWYRMAADQGNAASQLHLGTMYATGRGVSKDYAQALRWYRMAADQGEDAAEYNIGLIYANGLGLRRDPTTARQWMTRAATRGHSAAKQWLKAHQADR